MRFLEEMSFKTQSYRKSDLSNEKFVEKHPEARLTIHIFGRDKNVGTATIDFDAISSKEWQEKRKQKVREFAEKGIILQENSEVKE